MKDLKYIIKRIIIGTGIAILLMLFKGNLAYDVKAYEIFSTDTFGTAQNTLSCNDKRCGVVKNYSNLWTGRGYGLLHWSFAYYPDINTKPPVITAIRLANWNSQWFNCDYSATALSYNNSTNSDGNIFAYSVTCPVNFTNGGLKVLEVDMNGITNSWNVFYSIGSVATFEKLDDTDKVIDSIEDNKKAVQDLNDDINNDNVDESSSSASSFFNNFDSGSTGNLTDIISLPLDFLSSLNNSCSPINLTIPFIDTNITIPCMSTYLSQFLPSSLLNLIRLVINGIISYRAIASLLNFINGLKDPNNSDLEVMDL